MISYDDLWTRDERFNGHDDRQVQLMEEVCVLVDENDKVIGSATKKDCHLLTNIENGMLHRAFSVFLFDMQGRLLLQQRADEKITFPGCYTNTCCSHPLFTISDEMEETQQLGIKRAAQRKLMQELGIHDLPLDALKFITRIKYKAPSSVIWGEHEIDYILFAQQDVSVSPNPNEAKEVKYVTMQELSDLILSPNVPLTPWFKLIADAFLFPWWKQLDQLISHPLQEETIHCL